VPVDVRDFDGIIFGENLTAEMALATFELGWLAGIFDISV
jgi:hypothetical protein